MTGKGKGNQLNQTRARTKRNKDFMREYKQNLKCEMCGYCKNPQILCFHHNKGNKKFELNAIGMRSQKVIIEEINKCIVLCPNCHAEIHQKL